MSFLTIIYMEWGYILGMIKESMKVSGRIIKCMAMEPLHGLIKENI